MSQQVSATAAGVAIEPPLVLRHNPTAGVAVLTLNRPERGNGWTMELQQAYFDELDSAVADDEVRAVVVTGAGPSSASGPTPERSTASGWPAACRPR